MNYENIFVLKNKWFGYSLTWLVTVIECSEYPYTSIIKFYALT